MHDKQQRWSTWKRNVIDDYQDWSTEQIRNDLRAKAHPFAVLMEHWQGDFNISTMIRNANAFNAERVYYVGRRKFDRRGAVGTHHYVDLHHLQCIEQLVDESAGYTLVGLDNNIPDCVPLIDFEWPERPMMVFGEEGVGITPALLQHCKHRVHIKQWGSVRSMNVGTASGITMYDYTTKLHGT